MKSFSMEYSEEARACFDRIQKAFRTNSVPSFFRFIGEFPPYLSYITDEIVQNVTDEKLQALMADNCSTVKEILASKFPKKGEVSELLSRYRNSPEFYYFEKDLEHIFQVNSMLAVIFIALREAVKGWAVAAKKLHSGYREESERPESWDEGIKEELVYGGFTLENPKSEIRNPKQALNPNFQTEEMSITQASGLVKRNQSGIVEAMVPKYFAATKNEFEEMLKDEQLLYFRVELEKILLRVIHVMPYPINSPINVFFDLTKQYPKFPELLYRMSEQFPTMAVQRWMYSGWILP